MNILKHATVLAAVCLFFTGCMTSDPVKLPFNSYVPRSNGDGIATSTPTLQGMDPDVLEKAFRLVHDEERFVMARSLLVMRNGYLVAETYPHDNNDIDNTDNIQSCTKTFTSLLAGIALSRGDLDSLDQTLSSIYPEHFTGIKEKNTITLRDALSMKTGLAFDNSIQTLQMYQSKGSTVEFILAQSKLYDPGQVLHYNDGAPQLVAAAIQKVSGMTLSRYAQEYLFDPLGIDNWKWESAKDGVTFGAFGLYLTPRDMCKVGQMLLQHGRYNGRVVVDSAWIETATTPQGIGNFNGATYGLYFWLYPAYGAFAAEGHGGQILFVVPSRNIVIVYMAFPYTSSLLWDEYPELVDIIIASCS